MARLLVVDDESRLAKTLARELSDDGHQTDIATGGREALELIARHSYDLIVTDLSMPDIDGLAVLEAARAKGDSEIIFMTAHATVAVAVDAMKRGAAEFIEKPFANSHLVRLVNKTLEKATLSRVSAHYATELRPDVANRIAGASSASRKLRDLIGRVAPTDTTVLLTGPSGSGKEVAATAIHELSKRTRGPFIAINCAALTDTLLESELFGHEKGSFTGATALKRGRFELAEGGTIFLDEIAETTPALQTKLLRVLESRVFHRVGGRDEISCDVRVIAATNRELKKLIAAGAFREDLYFRLNVFPLRVPSLVERRDDIPVLSEQFLRLHGRSPEHLSPAAMATLQLYHWPGNIRELRNIIERAVILAGDDIIDPEHLGIEDDDIRPLTPSVTAGSGGMDQAERDLIVSALAQARGNKTEAAQILGITRRRLYSRMKAHEIDQ